MRGMPAQPRKPGAGTRLMAPAARAQVAWEWNCSELRRPESTRLCGADAGLPRDALPRNPLVEALDDGWWHGRLGRPVRINL